MKPNSALILDHDGIVLLQRSKGGWRVAGQADPSAPDLPGQMQYLRRTATELSGGQFATKLVIPNNQILYRRLAIDDAAPEHRAAAVRAGLDGLTPYAIADLAFDWHDAGPGEVDVAVVAEATLAEAEAFAAQHRFNPISFVAIPEPADFDGEPFFGETSIALKLLNPGGRVERDGQAIDINAVLAALEQEQGEAAPMLKAAVGGAGTFVSRRSDDSARHNPGSDPLQLKWVTPRLAPVVVGQTAKTAPLPAEPDIGVTWPVADATPLPEPAVEMPAPPAPNVAAAPPPPEPRLSAPKVVPLRAPLPPEIAKIPPLVAERGLIGASARRGLGTVGLAISLGAVAAVALASVVAVVLLGDNSAPDAATDATEIAAPTAQATPEPAAASPLPATEAVPDIAFVLPRLDAPKIADPAFARPQPALPEPLDAPRAIATAPVEAAPESPANLTHAGDFAALPINYVAVDPARIRVSAPAAPNLPQTDRVDDLYLASIDRDVQVNDAVALPGQSAAMPDDPVSAPGNPPPPGREFVLDEGGLVTPSAQGTLTPDGILVFAGPPAVTPLPRPGTEALPPPDGLSAERRAVLAAIRPMARPDGLVETDERSRLAGLSRTELGGLRPMPRPAAIEARAGEAPAEDTTPTAQAVVASLMPVPRPGDLAKAVNRALQEATATASAPAVLPPVPSGASVAQAATIKNGLRLNTISLIGVYGSSSNRKALVRLNGGRYVMVTVGDRLDGGQVRAISGESLIYAKNGRNVTLDLPNG